MSDGWRLGGRYLVGGRLGSGGMAEVFRAHDDVLRRDVAVKVFKNQTVPGDTATRVERRAAELHALARLNHPNLITLYDGELSANPAYLVMELVEGASLADRIRDGALAEHACRELGRQIASALAYVHDQGMVHRDVKPANILLGEDGRARLSDFGIVRLLDQESLTNADATLGTASYLAPEQMRGSQVGPAADVYALGLTLIEALTGTRSFDGPPLEAAMARLARDPVIPAHVAGPWPRLLAAMTAREPSARPTADQVREALETSAGAPAGLPADAPAGAAVAPLAAVAAASAASDTTAFARPRPAAATPAPPPEPGPEPQRRSVSGALLATAAAVLVLLIAGVAALLIAGSGGDSPAGGATTSPSRGSSTPSAPARSSAPGSAHASASVSAPPSSAPSTPPSSSSTASSASAPPSTSSSASSASSSSTSPSAPATSTSAGSSTSPAAPGTSTSATTAVGQQAPPPPPGGPVTGGP